MEFFGPRIPRVSHCFLFSIAYVGFWCGNHARRLDFFRVPANRSDCVKVVNLVEEYITRDIRGFLRFFFLFFFRKRQRLTSVQLSANDYSCAKSRILRGVQNCVA